MFGTHTRGLEDGVNLFRKDWVQSARAPLYRLYPWRNFDFERAQGRFSVVQFGRDDVGKLRESRRRGIDSNGVTASGVQHEIYAPDV